MIRKSYSNNHVFSSIEVALTSEHEKQFIFSILSFHKYKILTYYTNIFLQIQSNIL